MGLKSFQQIETQRLVTTPNAMTAFRAVGGPLLGAAMWRHGVDPTPALIATGLLAGSDDEGHPIEWASKPGRERIRDKLRLFPSAIGRKGDPIADKLLAGGVFLGGMAGGIISPTDAIPILVAEGITATSSVYLDKAGYEPRVNKLGKVIMGLRCAVMGAAIELNNLDGDIHQVAQEVVHGGAVAAGVGGLISCGIIVRDALQNGRTTDIVAEPPQTPDML